MRQRSLLFKRRRRGGILLELVLTIPFSLALIFIVIDVGRLVLASAALHDSVSVAARAGARTGEIGDTRQASGSGLCPDTVRDSTVYEAFCNAGSIPGAEVTGFQVITPAGNICRVGDIYVTVTAAADFEFLTDVVARGGNKVVGIGVPGLGSLFRSTKDGLTGSIHATGTARCEVAR